eukprot:4398870-Pyramimonas_sp.AAC.1
MAQPAPVYGKSISARKAKSYYKSNVSVVRPPLIRSSTSASLSKRCKSATADRVITPKGVEQLIPIHVRAAPRPPP